MFKILKCPYCKTNNYFFQYNKTVKCYNCYHVWKNPQTILFDYEV